MPPEIREKGKQHPVLRQTETACHIEEEEQDEHAHPHIHRQQRRCSGRQECRLQKGKRQCEADENPREIAEDQILELLDRREVDAADPDEKQRGKEEMRQNFQLERERFPPEEKDRCNRPKYEQDRTHAEHGRCHIAVVLDGDAVREVARQHNGKAAGEELREDEGVDHRPQKDRRRIRIHIVVLKQHLDREHHAREEGKRPCGDNRGVRIRLEVPRRRACTKEPFEFKSDARHVPPPFVRVHMRFDTRQ